MLNLPIQGEITLRFRHEQKSRIEDLRTYPELSMVNFDIYDESIYNYTEHDEEKTYLQRDYSISLTLGELIELIKKEVFQEVRDSHLYDEDFSLFGCYYQHTYGAYEIEYNFFLGHIELSKFQFENLGRFMTKFCDFTEKNYCDINSEETMKEFETLLSEFPCTNENQMEFDFVDCK